MARKPTTPQPGQNSALTEEELAALQHWTSQKIREERTKHDAMKAAAKAQGEVVNGLFSTAKGELKISRKDFEEMLLAEDMDESEFLAAEKARAVRYRRQGLPVLQPDLFGDGPKAAPDTADDQKRAYDLGYKIGIKAGDRTPPDTIATFLHPNWLEGYDAGQTENVWLFILANEAKAKLEKKDAKARPKLTAVEGGKGKAKGAAKGQAAEEPPPIGGPSAEEMSATPPASDSEGGQLTGGVLPTEPAAAPDGSDDTSTPPNDLEGHVEGPFTGTEPAGTTDEEWDAAEAGNAQAKHPPVGEQP